MDAIVCGMRYQKIVLESAETQERVEARECTVWEDYFDTMADAKRRAKYVISDDYKRSAELSQPLGYARIMGDGECVYDFFRD